MSRMPGLLLLGAFLIFLPIHALQNDSSEAAAAQSQSSPQVIPPAEQQARQEAVLELAETMMPREQFERTMQAVQAQVLAQAIARAQQSKKPLASDELQKLKNSTSNIVSYDEVLRWYADIYSAHFTVDEIHQIRDFYLSPVGEKLVRLRPAIAQETMAKILSIMAQRTPGATGQK